MSSLTRVLGLSNLSNEERRSLESTVGRIRSVSEFLSDAVGAVKELDFIEALQKASPWADAVMGSANDAFPVVKFVTKLFGRLTGQNDPNALALIAFTSVYQQSVNHAVRAAGKPAHASRDVVAVKEKLRTLDDSLVADALDFSGLSIKQALQHPFIAHADGMLDVALEGAGYDAQQRLAVQRDVHRRFGTALKTLLSHGDTAEKFAPLRTLIALGADEATAYAALARHAEYQRRLYLQAPVFSQEAFALSHIYIDSECGVKEWGALNERDSQGRKPNPFDESCGERRRIGETVLEYLRNPDFKDAVVIQGAAGAGKSAFTQWLSAELVRQGLTPIRVLMRHIPFDRERPIDESLREAIRYDDEDQPRRPRPADPFLGKEIFNEVVDFHGTAICPYVLILDAWDEISISVPQGFKQRLNGFLAQIRSEFLRNRTVPVRVILTGRPSVDVTESPFMQDKTPLLTLRPWNPDDLELYFSNLAKAVNERPLANVKGTDWPTVDLKRFSGAIEQYRKEFEEMLKKGRSEHTYAGSGSTLEILGMPLLAFLAARLLTEASPDAARTLLKNPTTLFRNLLDLTCSFSGRYTGYTDNLADEAKLRGETLRDLLRHTATAMTVYGKENISYKELEARLELEDIEVESRVEDDTSNHPLSQLIVSYYFKGGRSDLGCEFMHKSFREYLFAEEVVETLKKYGNAQAGKELAQRNADAYWADFSPNDPRHELSRALANRLSAQWITPEVARNLGNLLKWEIDRAAGNEEATGTLVGTPTKALELAGWEAVRDALADLWDWWAEGVHMRPQPTRDRTKPFENPLALDVLLNRILPRDFERRRPPVPPRLNIVDSHLGDALFRLSAIVHFQIAETTGWLEFEDGIVIPNLLWDIVDEKPRQRRCQVLVRREGGEWRLFAPCWDRGEYWRFYSERISGAGWRPGGTFPCEVDARGIFLRNANLRIANEADFSFSYLLHCSGYNGLFHDTLLTSAYLVEFNGTQSSLAGTGFLGSMLEACNFEMCDMTYAHFWDAWIFNTSFVRAAGEGSFFSFSTLRNTNFASASLHRCDYSNSEFDDVNFTSADLSHVTFRGVQGDVDLTVARIGDGVILRDGTIATPSAGTEPVTDPPPS